MSNKTLSLYKFEGFSLDAGEKCLRFADEIVSLTPKAYETLLVLIRRRGRMVEKETLLNEIWPDSFVEESTLAQNILTLRKALRVYNPEKQFIATVPSRGYRFVADVEELFSDEEIVVVEKHTQTKIVAEQKRIHDSADTQKEETAIVPSARPYNRSSRGYKIAAAGVAGIVVLAVGFVALNSFSVQRFAQSKFQKFRVDSVVSSADIKSATISPNGKYIAIVVQRGEWPALTLRQRENGNSIDLIPQITGTIIGVEFSPDGEQIYYSVYEMTGSAGSSIGSLYRIPLLGGASQRILQDIDSRPSISPDRSRIAFIRQYLEKKETALVLVDIDGNNERIIATRSIDEGFTKGGVAWSPDNRLLSCTVKQRNNDVRSVQIAVVAADSGEQKIISSGNWSWAGKTIWLKDGSGIVTVAFGARSPNLNDEIWLISYPEGNARSITNGINGILGLSISDDSNSIVAVKSSKITSFIVGSLSTLGQSKQIITRTGDDSLLPLGAAWTPDGRIIYSSTQNGNADIWTINPDGGGQKLITSDESAEYSPKMSNDGRFIIFLSNRSGQMNVWRTNGDGTNPKQLTSNEEVTDAIISSDGNTVYYVARSAENFDQVLWKVSSDGENRMQITSRLTHSPRISRDGKTIACYFPNAATNRMMLTLLSAETGEVIKRLETPRTEDIPLIDWSTADKYLYLVLKQNESFGMWKLPIGDGQAEKLHEWTNDVIFRFAISNDGSRVFYEKGIRTNDVVLLQDLSFVQGVAATN